MGQDGHVYGACSLSNRIIHFGSRGCSNANPSIGVKLNLSQNPYSKISGQPCDKTYVENNDRGHDESPFRGD